MGLFDGVLGKKKTFQEELAEKRKSAPSQVGSGDFALVEVQDVYSIAGVGIVPVGKVVEGILKIGMKSTINGKVGIVKTIEAHHEQMQQAGAGSFVGFNLSGVEKKDIVRGSKLRFGA
ncbi:MAG: EF-Tu/IF-2/RF-3 family GTPase [archaeon]|nr:EF-Tu/IF-2/RF-3 family GTPase [archaeon]